MTPLIERLKEQHLLDRKKISLSFDIRYCISILVEKILKMNKDIIGIYTRYPKNIAELL